MRDVKLLALFKSQMQQCAMSNSCLSKSSLNVEMSNVAMRDVKLLALFKSQM